MRLLHWKKPYARGALCEYNRYQTLKRVSGDYQAEIMSPSIAVDQMWHQHILDTRRYAADCEACGGMMHHNPDGDIDTLQRRGRSLSTLQLYEQHFKTMPPPRFWLYLDDLSGTGWEDYQAPKCDCPDCLVGRGGAEVHEGEYISNQA